MSTRPGHVLSLSFAPGSVAAYVAECDQEAGELSAPRDHTGDLLFAAYKRAETAHQWARENVADSERGLQIARWGEERAAADAQAAAERLRAHNPALCERAQWLIKGETPRV